MKIFELTFPHALHIADLPETVSAIGFFDGIHKGHQEVIKTAVKQARESKMESAVITFHPHPSVVLKKGKQHVKYITPMKEKVELLQQLDVDRLYVITFNIELSKLSPQDFIDHFIIGLNIKKIVAGFDYTFGHKGSGNMSNIHTFSRGMFTYTTIDQVSLQSEKVSSTKIRTLLEEGNVSEVTNLLGRPLKIRGTVIHGEKRGQELGYPTANLAISEDVLLPRTGVYAVKVIYKHTAYEGMASIGTNPTFTENRKDVSVEVNILDYNNDLYGEELQVEWYKFMRHEVKFNSKEELIRQMELDEENIRTYFSKI